MPFATNMQLFDASERLINILNETFTEEARKLAFAYEKQTQDIVDDNPDV